MAGGPLRRAFALDSTSWPRTLIWSGYRVLFAIRLAVAVMAAGFMRDFRYATQVRNNLPTTHPR